MKPCISCGLSKPLDQFHVRRKSKDGRQVRCKSCACAKAREQGARTPGHYFERNLRRHGLSLVEYGRLLARQAGRCAICDEPMHEPHIDHDHACCPSKRSCGACVRGLLCGNCNRGLGLFRDAVDRLHCAITYLEHV